ncbi:alpha/beta hydrolase [Umezawaea sp. Da 62-37]|uniref:alpha/beta hydrolase n=1 Tax=Umezawaea sp. Da 62-37 TaxID=3075927 RepID=UPI0028F6E3E0|nr:alpha/beta hydrolase [Umezawaea sp. Da 62-37]WNV85597.1 alpha/beta hydrolase [Umezawaea sp. Da 62-37]
MPLDPSTAVVLRALEAAGASALGSGTPESARAHARARRGPAAPIGVAGTEDTSIPGPAGDLAVRIYRPVVANPVPTVVYFHGGGFVIGDLDSHDDHCRLICRDVDAVVMSVEYRLAPEARFPEPLLDALAATRWAAAGISRLGADPARLAVAGDSAGGNLAAAVASALAGSSIRLAAQMLAYPKTDFSDHPYPSRVENAEGYYLTATMERWFSDHYLGSGSRSDPRASVVLAEPHRDLAPAVIGVGQYDLLRDEVLAYAAGLEAAGVPVSAHCFDGLVHGFFGMTTLSDAAARAVAAMNRDLRELLHVVRPEMAPGLSTVVGDAAAPRRDGDMTS